MEQPRLNRISIVLDEFGLDQIELAEILQVNKDTVSRWCRNVNQPKLGDLYRISQIFRIDIRRLIEPTEWANATGKSVIEKYIEDKKANKSKANLFKSKRLNKRK